MQAISSPLSEMKDRYDVLVIGSGYGGAIAASRMARAGRSVCLLERGREILVGDFPDTPAEALENMQFHTPDGRLGSALGLYDIHVNPQQNVVVGCGLGGTSLINANVALTPTSEVFSDPAWPPELRGEADPLLHAGIQRALEMLKPQTYPDSRPTPAKLTAHQHSAAGMGEAANFQRTPINVTFDDLPQGLNHVGVEQRACNDCGDCVSGCNVGAKNTTQMNYLPDAWNHGAEIFCQAEVRYLERSNAGWRVHYRELGVGREVFDAPEQFVNADIIILSAGTLGSNEIMLRSRAQGLAVSPRLGEGFSGNGDVLGFAYNCDRAIHGIGYGTDQADELAPVGPCITSAIDLRDKAERAQRMIFEEGSLPGAVGPFLAGAFSAAAGALGDDTDSGFRDYLAERVRQFESDVRGPYHGAVDHTQTYLIMSHDDAAGRAELNAKDQMVIDWPDVADQANFQNANQRMRDATAALGGTFVKNPISTPLLRNSLVTVHPLGGCGMAEDGAHGVVNHKGQVFTGTDTEVYPNLYISDGSVIPTSLAVNPLLTISAITERCCALIAKAHQWQIDYSLPSAPSRAHPQPKLGLSFTETMKGYFSAAALPGDSLDSYRQAAATGKAQDTAMAFTLTIDSDDLEQMLELPDHPAGITGVVQCKALSDGPLDVSRGVFKLFEKQPSPPDTRKMIYSMLLTDRHGEQFSFYGYKLIKDDPNTFDIWPDTSTLYVRVHRGTAPNGELLGKGILHIRPADFARQMTTMKVWGARNTTQKLAAMARFGRFFAGVLYQSYGGIFYDPGQPEPKRPRKQRPLRAPAPEVHGVTTADQVKLRLTRYQGGSKGPVLLVHGLGVGSTIFSTDLIDTNLVEYLVAHEYDVWLLDLRVSILLPASKDLSTGDQVAQFDYPAAIKTIRQVTGASSVQAVVHCYGATTFFMSMLGGLQGVRSIVCSQIATDVIVPTATAAKAGLHIPGFLDLLGVDSLSARVPEGGGSLLTQLYDRALSVYALAEAQGRCNSSTCHRITFMYASLYRHTTLNQALHDNLSELFGEANMAAFEHLALMCRHQRLMSATGEDRYLPHLERLRLPIRFISGEYNECYLPQSTELARQRLSDAFGPDNYDRRLIPGYGHIDCIFGANASRDVYPYIIEHLDKTALPD